MRIIYTVIIACLFTLTTACGTQQENNTKSKTLYTAHGENPSWDATVNENNSVVIRLPKKDKTYTIKTRKQAYAKGINYVGMFANKPFVLDINGNKTCTSARTNKKHDMTVYLEIDGQELKGCGKQITPIN